MNWGSVAIHHEFKGDILTIEDYKVRLRIPSQLSDCQNPGTINSSFDSIRDYLLGAF
jgi:hypothetical protein